MQRMNALGLLLPLVSLTGCVGSLRDDADDAGTRLDAHVSFDADSGVHEETDAGPGPCTTCPPCLDTTEPTAFEQALLDLPPHTWFEAPNSHMREVCAPDSARVSGVVGCAAVVSAWSSGVYDPIHRRMIVWGGGHDDYWGNELYGFDLRSGTWSRLTEPSVVPEGETSITFFNQDPLPDGKPVSRHTYDGVEFIEHLGKLWGLGGSRARDGGGTNITWMYDESAGWTQHASGPGGYTFAMAYDPGSRKVLVNTTESMRIYDIDTDTWTTVPGFGYTPLWPRYVGGDRTGIVDPSRGLYWVVGNRMVLVWDIAEGRPVTDDWVTTGGGDYTNADRVLPNYPAQLFESGGGNIYNVNAPGFDYDSATDAIVAWPNQGAPYALNLQTRVWTEGSPDGAPTSRNSGGTYGRWRYVAAYNVFVLVNSVDENVYFYKHTAGCGPQP